MKKQLLCGVAAGALVVVLGGSSFAADMPVKARPLAPAVFDWSGYYVGGHVGWGQSRFKGTWFGDSGTTDFAHTGDGILGGAQIGLNWQQNTFVYGLEADVSFMNFQNTTSFSGGLAESGDSMTTKL
jgi:outer membrane immunogenic protein